MHMSFDLKISKSQCRDEKSIFDAILQGYIDFESAPWPSTSASAKDLIKRMLMKDPKKRITACAKNDGRISYEEFVAMMKKGT
ncbi:Calcium-dependent protein kinase 9 [Vitis vinifera]|uniref:Calcium-dependent protein kinase 9 n=1 Tax=Vitis vinifera TaxID=29760 RepID=A0A438K479_VITVI|nr:Calcium-dependent protein kinase 9 [Vitis vinifera]